MTTDQQQEQTQDLHQIQTQVQEMDLKVDQILNILTGNELDKDAGGMIKTVKSHETRIISLEKFRDRLIIIVVVAAFFAGYGVWDLVNKVLLK
jgi:TolA-binding protein